MLALHVEPVRIYVIINLLCFSCCLLENLFYANYRTLLQQFVLLIWINGG